MRNPVWISQKQPTAREIIKAPVEPCMVPSPQQPFVFSVSSLWVLALSAFFPCSSLLLPSGWNEQAGGHYWGTEIIAGDRRDWMAQQSGTRRWVETWERSWRTFLSQLWVGGGILTKCLTKKKKTQSYFTIPKPHQHFTVLWRVEKDFGRRKNGLMKEAAGCSVY